jgi:ubiquinone/menaquinone biosynthesis C-methylase UbiE
MTSTATLAAVPAAPDFAVIKQRQQTAWSSGDYAIVGTTLQLVGESLCEAVDLHSGERVLDVAAGNGNASLAAARRWANVVSTDYVVTLLERGRDRARAEGLVLEFREADAEALPFRDSEFDVVLSTFGVMFAPNQEQAAAELVRVTKKGGRIGLANWTPAGFIGSLFKTIGKHVPPPPLVKSPALWGSPDRLNELFRPYGGEVSVTPKPFMFRYRSPQHWMDVFRTYYGPVLKTFAALDAQGQAALQRDLLMLVAEFNRAKDGTMVVPSDYLEVVVHRT